MVPPSADRSPTFAGLLLLLAASEGPHPPPAAPAEGAEEEAPALPELLVTARKWEEAAPEVPQSLTVLSAQTLRDAGIDSVGEAARLVPNLFVTEFSSRRLSFPAMRGIGSGQGDPAVTTYIGGVPQLTTSSTNLPLFAVERIEFLRGPQSTLYGRNALGGLIHIVPRPPTAALEAEAAVLLGSYDWREERIAARGPLTGGGLRFELAGLRSRRDGFTTNDFTGHDVDDRDSVFGRAGLAWGPADEWEMRFTVYGERARDGGFVLGELESLRDRPHHIDQDFEGQADRDILAPALHCTYYGDDVEVVSISAFQDWEVLETSDFDFSALDGVRRISAESQAYFHQEVRVASPGGAERSAADGPRWLAGAAVFVADSTRYAANEYRPAGAGILFPPEQVGHDTSRGGFDDWGAAVFGQATITPADDWDLGLGLRLDHEDKEADLRRTFQRDGVILSDVRTHLEADYDEVVPHVSLARRMTEDVLAYARAARGFKAGGFNLTAPEDRFVFGPETSWTYELGAKSAWLEERLRLDLALYHVDWDDMQLSLFDATAGGFVDNAGAATSQGVEVELAGQPCAGLELRAGLGTADTEFDSYVDPYGEDVSGNTLAFAPQATWNLGALLSGGEAEERRWFAHGVLSGASTFYYDAGNREEESFTLLDLRAGVERGRWRLEVWAKNALAEDYVPVAFQPNPADPTLFVGESGAPRTVGISLTARL
ncbi:MAG: TonB-dependent receptor [Planctomycetota bacterium]